MYVRLVKLFAVIGAVQLAGSEKASAQCSCAVPCSPSCAVPCSPSCAAPGGCGTCSSCQGCNGCKSGCGKPFIYIDRSKRIIKKNAWSGFGETPPEGFVVASVPAINLNTMALPISFNSGRNDNDLADAIARAISKNSTAGANNLASGGGAVCTDPCGDIRQLQDDMARVKRFIAGAEFVAQKQDEKLDLIMRRLENLQTPPPAGNPTAPNDLPPASTPGT